ncbi:MAG: PEP-CTERM sorting domain-containing protein [Alphaproteobacteria bacterium]
MKLIGTALAAGIVLAVSSGAQAIPISISCTGDQSNDRCTMEGSGGSTVSVTLDFTQVDANTIKVVVDNTSPTDHAPALLSFGFFVDPNPDLRDVDLTITAKDALGGSVDLSHLWTLKRAESGLFADIIADNGNGVQEGLYNPGVLTVPGVKPASIPFFTTAVFIFDFDQDVTLNFDDVDDLGSGLRNASVFVRFQNVGQTDGDRKKKRDREGGSAKVACSFNDGSCGGPTAVPEPGALAMLGFGLVGIAAAARRRRETASPDPSPTTD